MIYVIADLHISHFNIIRFCNRPFNDVHSMNKHITESWNKVVKPNDEVYILGDFSFKNTKRGIRDAISRLNGKKYMIKGNHDRTNTLNNLFNSKLIEWWKYDHEFEYEFNNKKYNFLLSHYPHYPIKKDNTICIFGHIHEKVLSDATIGMYNVGVDHIGYEPISIDMIIEHFEKNRNSKFNI